MRGNDVRRISGDFTDSRLAVPFRRKRIIRRHPASADVCAGHSGNRAGLRGNPADCHTDDPETADAFPRRMGIGDPGGLSRVRGDSHTLHHADGQRLLKLSIILGQVESPWIFQIAA